MKKIGRNDPCPCGSGKKYKKCHLNRPDEMFVSDNAALDNEPVDIFEKFEKKDKLIQFGALQLEPKNHGKNLRLEHLLFNAIKSNKTSITTLSYDELSGTFKSHYTMDYMEDPVDNFFTENIIFFGGNYIVYPGILEDGTQILNTFLEGIFTTDNNLPYEYRYNVHNAARLLLEISDIIAERCHQKRFQSEGDEADDLIKLPSEEEFNVLKNAITFSDADINKIADIIEVPANVIEEFVCKPESFPKTYQPDDLFLLNRPIYKHRDEYIVILPTGIIQAITNYIKTLAIEFNCTKELLNCYYKWQWKKVVEYAYEMSWKLTSIELPPTKHNLIEGVFEFDSDKLAYVCLIKTSSILNDDVLRDEVEREFALKSTISDKYKEREEEVLIYLNTLSNTTYRYFTLYILGSIGEMFFFSWDRPKHGNQALTFSFADFQKVIFDGNLDELSLWKFAKAYNSASEKTQFSPLSSTLNSYVMYKMNEGSMLPSDDAPPDLMVVHLGTATEFGRNAIIKRDEHAAPQWHNGVIAHAPVKKHVNYAPIYTKREYSLTVSVLVESYTCPIWIVNSQAKNKSEKSAINDFTEAIAFWLFKLTSYVSKFINQLGTKPIQIALQIDRAFLEREQVFELQAIKDDNVDITFSVEDTTVVVDIPHKISHLIILEHNAGERLIMKSVLKGLCQLIVNSGFQPISNQEIMEAIDAAIPLGSAKMILFVDAAKDPRLRTNNLLSTRYIQDAETSFILDNLVGYLNLPSPIPKQLATPKEKTELCGKVVSTLISQIEKKLQKFDATELLRWLIIYNERYVHNREFREILIPARIACFSDFPSEVEELVKKESKLVASSLSVRCLIEFVAAAPQFGNNEINLDDLDELFALMEEVCQWGVISDTIHFGMSDPQMGLLPSGRIGFSREFFNDFMKPFRDVRAENEVHDLVISFEEKMRITERKEVSYTLEVKEIDDAFASEYGITFTKVLYILGELMNIGISRNESVMVVDEQSLINTIDQNIESLTKAEVIVGLQILSLEKRATLSKPPIGFEKEDIYPWRYNRALSYIRRPLIKLKSPDGVTNYYWGFRHIMAAAENIRTLIFTGRLKTKEGTLLDRLIDKINTEKGHEYRAIVFKYLKQETNLHLIEHEVKISLQGHLQADKDYGDIDILAFDKSTKIIYSIECKNTVSARIPHEMKTELDKYLGREDAPGMIQKHVERDKWLQINKEKVLNFIKAKENYIIKSIVLTSDEIPLIYLAKEKSPLPIYSFKKLKRKGIAIFSEPTFKI